MEQTITKQRRSEQAFYTAFLDLLKENPFEKITVQMIVRQSGYSRSAFYSQFEDINDFFWKILDNEVNNYTNIMLKIHSSQESKNLCFPSLPFSHLFKYV